MTSGPAECTTQTVTLDPDGHFKWVITPGPGGVKQLTITLHPSWWRWRLAVTHLLEGSSGGTVTLCPAGGYSQPGTIPHTRGSRWAITLLSAHISVLALTPFLVVGSRPAITLPPTSFLLRSRGSSSAGSTSFCAQSSLPAGSAGSAG